MSETSTRVVIVGQGYVGLPVAMRACDVGHDVVGFDIDERRVKRLGAGESMVEDVTDEHLIAALESGRYHPTHDPADLAGFDVAVISVPTPLSEGNPDLSYIEDAARTLAGHLTRGATVVLESTTYPGTTEELVGPILEEGSDLSAGADFHLGYSPERIDPGNREWTFVNTPKVVSGIDPASLAAVTAFYDTLVERTVAVSTPREAELTKLLENTFRHVNIALVNELAQHSRALGIDIWEVVAAASSKPFGYMPFYPGPGVGGHCLPIDPSYLSWKIERQLGSVSRFVKIANDINDRMPNYVVQRALLGLNDRSKATKGSKVVVLGLSYKKNSNDARETPATGVIEGLLALGADVVVHDTHCGPHPIDAVAPRVGLTDDVLESADLVVLVTDHDDVDYARVLQRSTYVFDTRHRLAGDNVEHL